MAEIVGTITNLSDFLSKTQVCLSVKPNDPQQQIICLEADRKYSIPAFQREVRWDDNNLKMLLYDLSRSSKFLGNIILTIKSDHTCEIIDGQQRTTVLMLIVSCIKKKFGTKISTPDLCPLRNEGFTGFQTLLEKAFDQEAITSDDWNAILKSDDYLQLPRIQKLWNTISSSELLADRHKAQGLLDNLCKSEFNIIASYSNDVNTSIQYFLDVNLKGIRLDTEDIFKGYLFSQDSRELTRSLWQKNKRDVLRLNGVTQSSEEKRYPLMKLYEHFFYCDLYLPREGDCEYSTLKFGENFCLTSGFESGSTKYYEGSHLIEAIRDRDYLQNVLSRLNKCVEIMTDIIESEGPSTPFKDKFICAKKVDSIDIQNCHSMLKKILIIKEIMIVYKHDSRPWLIGYSGGKDSTLLVSLVYEAMKRLKDAGAKLDKTVHVITSDTMVENPIVKNYMHSSSDNINRAAGKDRLNIKASVIYPEPEQTFWSRVIGLGYPTPEPPGFRWCTDRLKIMPMNKFVNERIKESGEIIILLGVRKGESLTRMKTITAREIEGKLLNMHNDIPNAYVYNPITEIPNDLVWEFLLKGDCRSPWGSDMKYLFSLYQGENLGEEKSVLGEVDREKIPITGNSRFGCWCCTMVKEDKSLQNFINKGATELIPLREFRNELLRMRENSQYRDSKRRNGSVYKKSDGSFGMGPFTLEARCLILEKLLDLENRTGMELITEAELKAIDKMWDEEGDLTCRALVETYHKVKGKKLPWDDYKTPRFDDEAIQAIRDVADKYDIPVELITKLIVSVDTNKHITKNNKMQKAFDSIIGQGWLHYNSVEGALNHED